MKEFKLKRVVVKEEFVELTGDYKKAIVLNQMIYWSERVRDFDKFILEENDRIRKISNKIQTKQDLLHGWIYKSSEELSKETMMKLSRSSMRRILKHLVDEGYLNERINPKYAWDKTKQYRVDITYISRELNKIDYHLDGYGLKPHVSKQNIDVPKQNRTFQNRTSTFQNKTAIPEITSKITSDINKKEKNSKNFEFSENPERDTVNSKVRATGPHYTNDKVGRQALTTNTSEGDRPALVRANKTLTYNTNNNIINNKKKKTKNFENSEKEAVNFKLKHFTPETQREILRCLSGFDVSDKIKKITNDIFNNDLKEATL